MEVHPSSAVVGRADSHIASAALSNQVLSEAKALNELARPRSDASPSAGRGPVAARPVLITDYFARKAASQDNTATCAKARHC